MLNRDCQRASNGANFRRRMEEELRRYDTSLLLYFF